MIPPTPELVEAMLAHTVYTGDQIVGEIPERRMLITAEKIAINAVMAGCASEYMPVVVASVEAMCDPASGPHGPTASTRGAGLLLIVNGPPVVSLGINSGGNVFGPGVRANATIGRALRLIIMNCAGAYPGAADRATLGHPGKYSWCIGEDESDERWDPLHLERGFEASDGAVTTFWGLSPVQVDEHETPDPDLIVRAIGNAMTASDSQFLRGREIVVVIAAEHRESIAGAGWSKADVRACLHRTVPNGTVESPDDFLVVAAGGTGGRFAAFSINWGVKSGYAAVTKQIEIEN